MNSMKEYALYYASLGLAVFPIRPKGKEPLTAHGFQDATRDTERIKAWWTQWPSANIGIATGSRSGGLLVIDLDVDEDKGIDGRETLREWEAEHGKLPGNTWLSITGRGGYHYFYRTAEKIRNRTALYEGVDIRGEGGYVVAPPSDHPNGRSYQWEQGPEDEPLAEADGKVMEFLSGKAFENLGKPFEVPEQIPEGERTNTLVRLLCSQQAKGLSDEAIRAAVRAENEAKCIPPLTDEELEKTVFPALQRYQKGTAPYKARYDGTTGSFKPTAQMELPEPLDSITAKELQGLDLPPVEYIVQDFLPLGLAILGAPPKSFKSYMCLDMCLCISQGFDFLGFQTRKCECLYMDLESTRRRPKARIGQIMKGAEAPGGLHIVVNAKPIGKGFKEQLRQELARHPQIKVVVVDVFKKIRPPKKSGADPYERDYEDYGIMKQLADELGIAILLVTHTTKMKHPEDPFNELSGSIGTLGSVDVAMVIKKENREDETAKLYVTGRDLEDQCYEIKFNKETFQWEKLGTHKDMERLRLEYTYRNSPVVGTIKKLVQQNNGHWEGTAGEIISASKYFAGLTIYDDARTVGKEIRNFSRWMAEWDFIEFHEGDGSRRNGRRLVFNYNNPFDKALITHSENIKTQDYMSPTSPMSPMSPTSPTSPGDMKI